MNADRFNTFFEKGKNNPYKATATILVILAGLLVGMDQTSKDPILTNQSGNNSDFNMGELDGNNTEEQDKENKTDNNISVEITSEVCVEKKNQTGFNCTNTSN